MLEKKYPITDAEKEMQKYWETEQIYKFEENDKKIYSVDTPPPTISGKLHIGHIFSYTQAEILVRFKRLIGYNIFYPFGFDDNGLPTERLVEKKLGIMAKDMPRSEFIDKCKETIIQEETEFIKLWKSLGFSVDWSLQYETISDLSRKISQRSFLELAKKGHAYQKDMPVLWCTHCETSIAQAELESIEKDTYFNYIKFKVDDEDLIIATTRPEYLNSCVALFVHPDDERYSKYIGRKAKVPLYNFEVDIYSDSKVEVDKGTGIVMCCTYGDITDEQWQREYNLPYKKLINNDGYIEKNIPFIGGMNLNEARLKIVDLLKENNLLVKSDKLIHSINVHERCSTDIEIIPSKQWYIDVMSIKDELLDLGNKINWYPNYMKSRYTEWVTNLKWDWCISRQRFFGVPFPIWYCKNCGAVIFADEKDLPVNPLEDKPNKSCNCGCNDFIPEKDVMDTWATSSVTPLINAKYKEEDERTYLMPMSMRCQAHDIIRTWAFYTIVKSFYHKNDIPWKDIMISGFVLAKKGEKFSKSKDNATFSPTTLIEKHGADVIRYWAASNKLGTDTMFNEEDIILSNRFLIKLWNASKFSIMQLEDYNVTYKELMPIDKWIIERSKEVTNNYIKYMNNYEMGLARSEIDKFFWNDFCDNYLEIVKERLYQKEKHGIENVRSGQYALYQVLLKILQMYSPMVPHITEYIYLKFFKERENNNSITTSIITLSDTVKQYLEFGDLVTEIIIKVRKHKTVNNMSMKDELNKLIIKCNDKYINSLKQTELDLKACTSAKEINIISSNDLEIIIE
ncbi:MAG: valine--tRNA ligase [Bacilli bacterium]|nr:valine--tRNA ligase [Bacilli bacterium]